MAATATAIDSAGTLRKNFIDQRAIELSALATSHWDALYRQALRHLNDPADAEDAVQEGLLSAYRHLEQFRGQAQMSTWLCAIVVNAARMQTRRRMRRTIVPLDEGSHEGNSYALAERLADKKPNPEEARRKSEFSERVSRMTSKLSPSMRSVFRMCHVDGYSIRETAKMLGIPEGTVKARASRARARLMSLMRKERRTFDKCATRLRRLRP